MFTRTFLIPAVERAAKTVAQTLLSLFLVGDVAFNLFTFAWGPALGIAAGAAVISMLTSVVSYRLGPMGSPSLVDDSNAAIGRHAA